MSAIPAQIAQLPQAAIPKHVAIIMDGNGRWAENRGKKRVFGHQAGVKSVRRSVSAARELGVKSLTLFAFSSENWGRPSTEVNLLMELFFKVLTKEVKELSKNGIRLNVIGDTSRFSERLQLQIAKAEQQTEHNDAMVLNIAANYGGRWDITQAAQQLALEVAEGQLNPNHINEELLASRLSMQHQQPVDLMIRTGGDCRISNFILWQAAYAELVFTDVLWPDFEKSSFYDAIECFANRQRRFGLTGEQVENGH
ncbi:isoprenyl transferase [Paraferrimonas haliotis]|uniref:Ditrans,polycis-undecaprenyl-diphosphate synthase ((2E,6E)-farnesyl-diphosphate specific) n=1 Tax=Paraferrimonas haliotis TaxID=2013866 RepID=A0AA37TR15_9GAMM|nr:isoprenyl transferase [Paraferrimonas haliotis]GLS82722.1 ditrans,polycis-undecaprenyl-diphosphate synthase [Paraferrimonas haliotis]